jgi:hypothetical protein
MYKPFLLIALATFSQYMFTGLAYANTGNNEKSYSGSYSCKGNNSKVGDYGFNLTLKLNKANSREDVGAYELSGETENSTMYAGNAVAIANKMSLAFRISDHKDNVFGSGMAVFKLNQDKLWVFTTHYFEPDETGGVSGVDVCTQHAPATAKKVPEETSPKKAVEDVAPKKVPEDVAPKKAPEVAPQNQ